MGVLGKLLDAFKLDEDLSEDGYFDEEEGFDDDFDEEDFLDDDEEEKPKKKIFSGLKKKKVVEDLPEETEEIDLEPVKAKKEEKKPAFDLDDLDDGFEEKEEKVSSKFSFHTGDGIKVNSRMEKFEKAEKTEKSSRSSKITPMRSKRTTDAGSMEVCVIKPKSMEDTREIADTLLDNSTVILSLEGIDVDLAQRITDFSSGACYSLGGRLQKVSSYIFVLVPYNVEITGDLQNVFGSAAPSVRAGY